MSRIAIGPLAGNPFPDATPEFFEAMARALTLGLAHPLTIDTPFAELHKPDVIRLGIELGVPLGLTISCMNPRAGLHCGRCSKCRERRDAFLEAARPRIRRQSMAVCAVLANCTQRFARFRSSIEIPLT